MDFIDHCNLVHKKANQMRSALLSLVVASIAAYLVYTLGGAPWWLYAVLFARFVVEFAQALSDEPVTPKASDDCFGELPGCAIATGLLHGQRAGCPKTDG